MIAIGSAALLPSSVMRLPGRSGARPKPHFSRKSTLLQQLRLWSDEAIAAAADRLHMASADSRKLYDIQDMIARRALLAVCMMAVER
jgi:DNA polymerase-3 subunit delta